MRRILLLAALLLAVTGVKASDWNYQWGHVIDAATTGGDAPCSVAQTADGNYVAFYQWGSNSSNEQGVYIDSDKITGSDGQAIVGQAYSGTSYNRNVGITKFDATFGTALWTVYSNMGDIEHSYSSAVSTADGGLVVMSLVRAFADQTTTTLVQTVGADGVVTPVVFTPEAKAAYKVVLTKIDGSGKVLWSKMAIDATHYTSDGTFASEPVYTSGLSVDAEGNIYIAGNYRTTMKLINGTDTTSLTATNTAGYDGSIQTVAGDLFVAKFDANGNYQKHLAYTSDSRLAQFGGGNASMSQFDKILIDGSVAYVLGRAQLNGTGNFQDLILASLNTADLSVNYVNTIKATAASDSKHTTQVKGLQLLSGKLYLTGCVKGGFESGSYTCASQGKPLEGYVIKANPSDGSVEGMACDGTNISCYFGAVETNDSLVAIGYNMTKGVIAVSFDKSIAAQGSTKKLVTGGTIALMAEPLLDKNSIVIFNRNRGTAAAAFYGTETTITAPTTTWDLNISKFTNEDVIPTAVTSVNVDDQNDDGQIYNIWGQKVSGTDMQPGIYIKGHKKIFVK